LCSEHTSDENHTRSLAKTGYGYTYIENAEIRGVFAGYKTHMFGKWDAGMATPDHTPHGRGYSSALHYYHHCNDYWNYVDGAGKALFGQLFGHKTIDSPRQARDKAVKS